MIEWREGEGTLLKGYIGDACVFVITGSFSKTLRCFLATENFDTLDQAKAKAEELVAEWLEKANLMVKPENYTKGNGMCIDCGGLLTPKGHQCKESTDESKR